MISNYVIVRVRRCSCQTPCCSGFSYEGPLYLLPLKPSLTAASFPLPLNAAARGERQPRRPAFTGGHNFVPAARPLVTQLLRPDGNTTNVFQAEIPYI